MIVEGSWSGFFETHQLIGVLLISGFLVMLLVEQVLRMYETSNKTGVEEKLITRSPHGKGELKEKESSKQRITYCVQVTLIGILLHCISDGFAFGISGYSRLIAQPIVQESSFNYKVFFALTLNKAPEIFSVSTFLLHENYKKSTVHKNILVLASAPSRLFPPSPPSSASSPTSLRVCSSVRCQPESQTTRLLL